MRYFQFVKVKTQFIAFHCWPEAPDGCAYLRNKHRHVFHVEMLAPTTKDRQIEFITLRKELDDYLKLFFGYTDNDIGSMSCERIAQRLMDHFNAESVGVYEDDENGVVLVRQLDDKSITGD